MSVLEELIVKLKAASEESDDLNREIARMEGWVFGGSRGKILGAYYRNLPDGTRTDYFAKIPAYTTSIDAALTLVPPDPSDPSKLMLWSLTYDEDGVAGPRSYTAGIGKGYHDPDYIYGHSDKTPALALCIAALKARLSMSPEVGQGSMDDGLGTNKP